MTLLSLRQLLDFTPAHSFVVSIFNVSKMEQVQAIPLDEMAKPYQ